MNLLSFRLRSFSGAQRVYIIGHGPGCQSLMDLLAHRSQYRQYPVCFADWKRCLVNTVTKYVKAVIQIMGHSKLPLVPRQPEELRSWYAKVCGDKVCRDAAEVL
jgi:histone deacetylase 6